MTALAMAALALLGMNRPSVHGTVYNNSDTLDHVDTVAGP